MVTIFSCPKPFTDPRTSVQQHNAVGSWKQLRPTPTIILVGDEPGTEDICAGSGLLHLKEVDRSEFGTPIVSDLFARAEGASHDQYLAFVNSDIILFQDFANALQEAFDWNPDSLVVGGRIDLSVEEPIQLDNPKWEDAVRRSAGQMGVPMRISSDYFAFRKGSFSSMPPFAIGRPAYDNWFFWAARRRRKPVVDASSRVLAIHQVHRGPEEWETVQVSPESQRNKSLAGRWASSFTLDDATHEFSDQGITSRRRAARIHRVRVSRNELSNIIRHNLGLIRRSITRTR